MGTAAQLEPIGRAPWLEYTEQFPYDHPDDTVRPALWDCRFNMDDLQHTEFACGITSGQSAFSFCSLWFHLPQLMEDARQRIRTGMCNSYIETALAVCKVRSAIYSLRPLNNLT